MLPYLERFVKGSYEHGSPFLAAEVGYIAVCDGGSLVGYVSIRPVISGIDTKVGPLSLGPLYANNDIIAKLLLKTTANSYIADTTVQETQIEILCCGGVEYGLSH